MKIDLERRACVTEEGLFYALDTPFNGYFENPVAPDKSWYLIMPEKQDREFCYGQQDHESSEKVLDKDICPKEDHCRRYITKSCELDLHYYKNQRWEFFPLFISNDLCVSATLRRRLETETEFRGTSFFRPVTHSENYPKEPLEILAPTGRVYYWPPQVRPGVKNECRQCGYGPIFCDTCGHFEYACPQCKANVASLKDPAEKISRASFIVGPLKRKVLWGKTWDGSDFCNGMDNRSIITRRVLDWLLMIHAKPLLAEPLSVCTTGMSEQQLKWLEAARGR